MLCSASSLTSYYCFTQARYAISYMILLFLVGQILPWKSWWLLCLIATIVLHIGMYFRFYLQMNVNFLVEYVCCPWCSWKCLFGWVSWLNLRGLYKYAPKVLFPFTPYASCGALIPQFLTVASDFFLEFLPGVTAHRLVLYCMFPLMNAITTLFTYSVGLHYCFHISFLLDGCYPYFDFFSSPLAFGFIIFGNFSFTQLSHYIVMSRLIPVGICC